MNDEALTGLLLQQEQALLTPDVRRSRALLEELLAPDFQEFGSSGVVFDRQTIVAALQQEAVVSDALMDATVCNFCCTRLGADAALVTYTIVRAAAAATLRSSVWVLRQQRWVMLFHQGTRAAAA